MKRHYILIPFFFLLIPSISNGESTSVLGLDYLEITKNQIIADAMLEMEPALIEHYSKGEWKGSTEGDRLYAIRLKAFLLGKDKVSEDTYQTIIRISSETPLRFLELDKDKYPNLWRFGNVVRLDKRIEDGKWLYKALHGKEWEDRE